jgi:gamma-glutamyltranspeptidase / glutathione hydrolase
MTTFDWSNPYPTARTPLFARNIVSTSQPLAAQAGLRMLLRGGNAVDAAIAAAAALTIVEPVSCGLGGDAFALVWDGTGLHGLNGSGAAPAAWTPEYFSRHANALPERGWGSVTVPGMVSAWVELSERFGTLPFADLLEPAIDLAERGFLVSPRVAQKWAAAVPILRDQPGFAQAFMPHGRAPFIGEHFALPAAARSLTRIAASRGEAFYHGELAEAMVAHARQHGGAMDMHDLAGHAAEWVTPITKDYLGYSVHEMPPNGQGVAALMALAILEKHDVARYAPDSADSQHLQIEAMKLAFADVNRWVADAAYMKEVGVRDLLDDSYLARRAQLIDVCRATDFGHGDPPSGGTIYLCAADERGMMVSFIQSNYMGFGSGVVVPETGISLHNRGYCFTLQPGHPNRVAPRKRPFHTIIPAFLTRAGQPQMSFGVMGGSMQPQGHLQTLVRMLSYGQQPQAACDAPRWRLGRGLTVHMEHRMPEQVVAELRARGHQVDHAPASAVDFGAGQFIWKTTDGYIAASDPRRDGQAVGY